MRDIRADLIERLEAVLRQSTELEAQKHRLLALLRDEDVSHLSETKPESGLGSKAAVLSGVRLREFILGSLADGESWSLEDLKEHAHRIGLTSAGASGRSLNITLVNLLREGSVFRLRSGRWRLREQATQLPLDLA